MLANKKKEQLIKAMAAQVQAAGVAPATVLPDFVNPAVPHGELSQRIIAKHQGDMQTFIDMTLTEMQNMSPYVLGGGILMNGYALGHLEDPVPLLLVEGPGGTTAEQLVQVMHCTRQYFRNPHSPADPADVDVDQRTIGFIGDWWMGQLPQLKLEPITGLSPAFVKSPIDVPTEEAFTTAINGTATTADLISARTGATQENLGKVCYVPSTWVPAFIEGIHPQVAAERAQQLAQLFPPAEQPKFDYILKSTRAMCMKTSPQNPMSQMTILLRDIRRRSQNFVAWADRQMQYTYPTGHPPRGGLPPPVAGQPVRPPGPPPNAPTVGGGTGGAPPVAAGGAPAAPPNVPTGGVAQAGTAPGGAAPAGATQPGTTATGTTPPGNRTGNQPTAPGGGGGTAVPIPPGVDPQTAAIMQFGAMLAGTLQKSHQD